MQTLKIASPQAVPIRQFGRAIALQSGDVLLVLKMAIDASKTETGPGLTAVAGYIGSLDDWDAVEAEWRKAVDDWRIPERFHLTELEIVIGRERSPQCLAYFKNIIANSNLIGIGAVIIDEAWPLMNHKKNPSAARTRYEECLFALFKSAQRALARLPDGEQIAVVCDADASDESIHRIFAAAQANAPALTSITIGSSKRITALQCADMAAGLVRRTLLAHSNSGWRDFTSSEISDALPRGKPDPIVSITSAAGHPSAAKILSVAFKGPVWMISYTPEGGRKVTQMAMPELASRFGSGAWAHRKAK